MSSVRRIAKEAGVSITTVSRALNNDATVSAETRERILAIANRSGYVAKTGRRVTTNIGFAYTGRRTVADVFDAALLDGVTRGVDECNFDVVLLNMQRDKRPDETYTQYFMRKGVRGVVLRTTTDSRHVCLAIAKEGFPAVVISERFDDPNLSYIDCDSKTDSVRAVEYLISLGHRRIAFAMHNVPDCDHVDRYEGYRAALDGRGLKYDEKLVFRHQANFSGGATVLQMVMSMPDRPTAIYLADPSLAIGAINQAQLVGVRVPDDLSIVGFDDTEMRYGVFPTMTAVCQDSGTLGFEAALHLTRTIAKGTHTPFQKTVPTFFEVHDSTGPPPEIRAVAAPNAGLSTQA